MKVKVQEIINIIKRKGGKLPALISTPWMYDYSATEVSCRENWLLIKVECMHERFSPEAEIEVYPDGSFVFDYKGLDKKITILHPILKNEQ